MCACKQPAGSNEHTLVPFALVLEPETGISLEAATTFPGVQLFTANGDCVKNIKGAGPDDWSVSSGFNVSLFCSYFVFYVSCPFIDLEPDSESP